ncbi:MAG: hypothetical protein M3498_16865 [Deinococcota bacterium]|jgi:hypothetical protein|nr:hypothetical protein [Deinococcota bacterium]
MGRTIRSDEVGDGGSVFELWYISSADKSVLPSTMMAVDDGGLPSNLI